MGATQQSPRRLSKLTPDSDPVTGERLSRYEYCGFEIERERRTWSERNGNQVGGGAPLYWWSVYLNGERRQECDSLRDARAWVDAHVAEATEAP